MGSYYWVSFHHYNKVSFGHYISGKTNEEDGTMTDDMLAKEVFPYTSYAEFVCYRNDVYKLVYNTILIVQGIIQTDIQNLRKGCGLYDHITKFGKSVTILPLPLSELDRKRSFLQYACVMYPDAYLCTSVGVGGKALKTTVANKQKAISDYMAMDSYALDEGEYILSRSVPRDYFDWFQHCKYVSSCQFDKNDEFDKEVIQKLEEECNRYIQNTRTIDSKKDAIFSFLLGNEYKKKLYSRKISIKMDNRLELKPKSEVLNFGYEDEVEILDVKPKSEVLNFGYEDEVEILDVKPAAAVRSNKNHADENGSDFEDEV